MDRDRANDLVEMCKAALSQTLVESSSLMIDAAEQLLAMRPATDEEIQLAIRERYERFESDDNSWGTRGYRAAERRLLPFADEVKR